MSIIRQSFSVASFCMMVALRLEKRSILQGTLVNAWIGANPRLSIRF